MGSREPKTMGAILPTTRPYPSCSTGCAAWRQKSPAPERDPGVIVGVETHQHKIKDDVIQIFMLNLMTAQGLRSVPLEQVQQIKLLDAPLDNEFRTALKSWRPATTSNASQ